MTYDSSQIYAIFVRSLNLGFWDGRARADAHDVPGQPDASDAPPSPVPQPPLPPSLPPSAPPSGLDPSQGPAAEAVDWIVLLPLPLPCGPAVATALGGAFAGLVLALLNNAIGISNNGLDWHRLEAGKFIVNSTIENVVMHR